MANAGKDRKCLMEYFDAVCPDRQQLFFHSVEAFPAADFLLSQVPEKPTPPPNEDSIFQLSPQQVDALFDAAAASSGVPAEELASRLQAAVEYLADEDEAAMEAADALSDFVGPQVLRFASQAQASRRPVVLITCLHAG